MKEKLYTIPLTDAFQAGDECPFCYIERKLEEHTLDFVLGSGASYMEDDIRAETDAAGFCRIHYKKMYDYGNRLGMGLILKTHMKKLNQELEEQGYLTRPGMISKRYFNDRFAFTDTPEKPKAARPIKSKKEDKKCTATTRPSARLWR